MTTHYVLASDKLVRELNTQVGNWMANLDLEYIYSVAISLIVEYELNKLGYTSYVSRAIYPKGVGRPI